MDLEGGLGWILGGSKGMKPKALPENPIPDTQFKKPV